MPPCLTARRFSPQATALRAVIDKKFANPRTATAHRFVWDYWHIPGQYTLLRTPALDYFPPHLSKAFVASLLAWGRRVLGCHAISPPWLSSYIDGCEQELHADNPHGPWAFVYSLSRGYGRQFTGGETMILKPQVLNYWHGFSSERGKERTDFFKIIPPHFDQLVVFDPRLPHGVRRVQGPRDPAAGRLVIHGWFTDPRPFVEGPLSTKKVHPILETALFEISKKLGALGTYDGVLTLRVTTPAPGGRTPQAPKVLTNTLRATDPNSADALRVAALVRREFAQLPWPQARGDSAVTVPIVFSC